MNRVLITKGNPTPGDRHVNGPMTQFSEAFIQRAEGFVARRVFPEIFVEKKSDVYFKYSMADFFRDQMQKRAPRTEAAEIGYRLTTGTYDCEKWAAKTLISDDERANNDAPLNPDIDASEFLGQVALIRRERDWATDFFTTSVWTGDQTGTAGTPGSNEFLQWNDVDSDPVNDISAQQAVVLKRTGYKPNKFVCGFETWLEIKNNPTVRALISGAATPTTPAIVTKQAFAAMIEVDEVLVMEGVYNSALEGLAASNAFIGGKSALLVYAPKAASLRQISGGYTMIWRAFGNGVSPSGARIKKYRNEDKESDTVEIQTAFDHVKTCADAGVFFTTAVA